MSAVWNIFWCKVFFKEFIRHYRKMTDEQIVKDVRQSMDDLEDLVDNTDSFGSQMVRWSTERAEQPFATAARENGKKGGRPRKTQNTDADAPTREDGVNPEGQHMAPKAESGSSAEFTESTDLGRTGGNSVGGVQKEGAPSVRAYRPRKVPHPKGEYEVFDFASENGIPEWVANEFYQRFFVERDGTDNDGNNIDNWKGALINYNKSRKREPA